MSQDLLAVLGFDLNSIRHVVSRDTFARLDFVSLIRNVPTAITLPDYDASNLVSKTVVKRDKVLYFTRRTSDTRAHGLMIEVMKNPSCLHENQETVVVQTMN